MADFRSEDNFESDFFFETELVALAVFGLVALVPLPVVDLGVAWALAWALGDFLLLDVDLLPERESFSVLVTLLLEKE